MRFRNMLFGLVAIVIFLLAAPVLAQDTESILQRFLEMNSEAIMFLAVNTLLFVVLTVQIFLQGRQPQASDYTQANLSEGGETIADFLNLLRRLKIPGISVLAGQIADIIENYVKDEMGTDPEMVLIRPPDD